MMITVFVYGWALDQDNYVFVYVFPVASVLGMISVFLLSKIPYENDQQPVPSQGTWSSIRQSVKDMKVILLQNVPFRDFQIGFMLYGFGFMTSTMVIVLFFDQALNLNYSSIAIYKNAYNLLAILMLPLLWKTNWQIDPRNFAAISFMAMFFFILSLLLTQFFPEYEVYGGIMLYHTLVSTSCFMGSLPLPWP
jgi:Na+/melibiose symporter-like transporter